MTEKPKISREDRIEAARISSEVSDDPEAAAFQLVWRQREIERLTLERDGWEREFNKAIATAHIVI